MNNMMTLWAEAFLKMYPNVKVQVEGKGSLHRARPPSSRAPRSSVPCRARCAPTEIDQFESKYGYKPTQLRTSYDALAVYVNKDNPIEKLTLAQVDAVFSKTRRRGCKQNVDDLGPARPHRRLGQPADQPLRPQLGHRHLRLLQGARAQATATTRTRVKEQPGSASVVQGVTEDRFGIGYSGIGYKTSGVKVVPLAEKDGGAFSDGNYEDVKSGKYPLTRFLYIYINKAPGKPLDPLVKEFVKFIFSKEGQEVVVKDGYLPLSPEIVKQELAKLE